MPSLTAPKNIPTVKINGQNISAFKGVDLSNAPSNVKEYRSPAAPNMMPDLAGKPIKRTGFHKVGQYDGAINGVHFLKVEGVSRRIVHAGEKLYLDSQELYTGMQNARSKAWQMESKLWILDGKKLLCVGDFPNPNFDDTQPEGEANPKETLQVKSAEEMAYLPTVAFSRDPTGGGKSFEPVNLLTGKRTDSFLGTASATEYQLSFDHLDDTPVTARKLNAQGEWVDLSENTDFTVNRELGKVTFTAAPGASPSTGEDNVEITYSLESKADRINGCDIAALYGVSGSADRLFVSGNPKFPNYDWYSELNDPTYFGDLWYSVLGQDNARIMGYSIISDQLAAHKEQGENGQNVIIRKGVLTDGEAAFPICATLQGEGAVSKHAFAYLSNEPLFLTSLGVYAITAQDVTGEKYSQNRSFYLNKVLTAQPGLDAAFAMIYKDWYMLSVGDRVYILDGAQRSYEPNAPYSTFQYECYYWEGINAHVMWEEDGVLCFGTSLGEMMEFYADFDSILSYNDEGEPITAYWELPDFDGKNFYKNKTIKYVAVRLASATATSVQIWALVRGVWKLMKAEMTKGRYLAFSKITFSKFTFSCDTTPRTIGQKIKIKKVDKVRFRLLNDQLNEPFGIYEMSLEYTENGRYKR